MSVFWKFYFILFLYAISITILVSSLIYKHPFFYLILTGVFIFHAFFILLLFFISRKSIVLPLRTILSHLTEIAHYGIPRKIELKTKDEIGIIVSAINQMIFALTGHREVLEEKLQGLNFLTDILTTINSNIYFPKIMQTTLDKISYALQSEEVIIFTKNEEDELSVFFTSGDVVKDYDIRFKIGEGIAGLVAKTGESLIVNETEKDERFKEIEGGKKIYSLICIPLKVKEEVIGVLSLANKKTGVFQENDKIFLEILAPSIAIAIDNARLWEAAVTDELSGLYTFRYFKYILGYEFKRAKRYSLPLSLVLIDIDFFKKINDSFGHLVGDMVIEKIGKIIKESIREIDIACRWGGEEFAIILPQTNKYGAKTLADRIREKIKDTKIKTADGDVTFSASFGIADNLLMSTDEELVYTADKMLYRAKEEGRDRVVLQEKI